LAPGPGIRIDWIKMSKAGDKNLVSPDLDWVPISDAVVQRTAPNYRAKLFNWRKRRRRKALFLFGAYFALFVITFTASFVLFSGLRMSDETRTGLISYISGKLGGMVFAKEPPLPPVFDGKRDIHILLVGLDKEPPHRSDSVLVAHIDLVTYQTRILSVPRDLRVEMASESGGRTSDKLAHAYVYGGVDNVKGAVENLLGIGIDHYAIVKIEGLVQLIDLIGGIEIDVEKDMRYRDRAQGLKIDLKEGLQHLNGDDAVDYSRFRHDAEGDNGRMRRQQQVIRAIVKEIRRPRNLGKLPAVLAMAYEGKLVETDMRVDQWLALKDAAEDLTPDKIQTMTLFSEPDMIGGISYQIVKTEDLYEAIAFLADLTPPEPEIADGAAADSTVPVQAGGDSGGDEEPVEFEESGF